MNNIPPTCVAPKSVRSAVVLVAIYRFGIWNWDYHAAWTLVKK